MDSVKSADSAADACKSSENRPSGNSFFLRQLSPCITVRIAIVMSPPEFQ